MAELLRIIAFGPISLFKLVFVGSLIFRRYLGCNRNLSPIHDQMAIVQTGHYFKRRLLNGEEYQLFRLLENWIKEHPGFRLFVQVSLGEIIGSDTGAEKIHSAHMLPLEAKEVSYKDSLTEDWNCRGDAQ